jgi:uncharacterized protein YbjQ (UPF0145 family)
MLTVTVPAIEGKCIARYPGIVSGKAIMGANIITNFFARIDVV